MVREPGGQLITRVKTGSDRRQVIADIGDHSTARVSKWRPVPGLCPPNAADLQSKRRFAQAMDARHAGLVDRLQHRIGEEPRRPGWI